MAKIMSDKMAKRVIRKYIASDIFFATTLTRDNIYRIYFLPFQCKMALLLVDLPIIY